MPNIINNEVLFLRTSMLKVFIFQVKEEQRKKEKEGLNSKAHNAMCTIKILWCNCTIAAILP